MLKESQNKYLKLLKTEFFYIVVFTRPGSHMGAVVSRIEMFLKHWGTVTLQSITHMERTRNYIHFFLNLRNKHWILLWLHNSQDIKWDFVLVFFVLKQTWLITDQIFICTKYFVWPYVNLLLKLNIYFFFYYFLFLLIILVQFV